MHTTPQHHPEVLSRLHSGSIATMTRKHAHWLPRLAFAGVFLFHGIGKMATLESFAMMMMIPLWVAALVATCELLGGLFVLSGGLTGWLDHTLADMLTRMGGAVVAPVLVGAIVMFHWGQWSFVPTESHPMGGMEYQMVLLSLALYFAVRGNEAVE